MAYDVENEPGEGQSDSDSGESSPDESSESMDKVTGTISLDAFPDRPKIGQVCQFRIVDVTEDGSAELEYVDHNAKGNEPVPPWDKPNRTSEDEMLNR